MKPKEWWIYDNGEWFGSMVSETPLDEDDLKQFRKPEEIKHVIEYSAFKKAVDVIMKVNAFGLWHFEDCPKNTCEHDDCECCDCGKDKTEDLISNFLKTDLRESSGSD